MTRTVEAAELILLVFLLLMLAFAALCMWMDNAPERDEDEELRPDYEQLRRLPL